ncbi:MAG: hypothetical protein LC804_14970 [Acidobacteria bacterium]|nr:hypothetical protein [Acidobacteriota bacterium]
MRRSAGAIYQHGSANDERLERPFTLIRAPVRRGRQALARFLWGSPRGSRLLGRDRVGGMVAVTALGIGANATVFSVGTGW